MRSPLPFPVLKFHLAYLPEAALLTKVSAKSSWPMLVSDGYLVVYGKKHRLRNFYLDTAIERGQCEELVMVGRTVTSNFRLSNTSASGPERARKDTSHASLPLVELDGCRNVNASCKTSYDNSTLLAGGGAAGRPHRPRNNQGPRCNGAPPAPAAAVDAFLTWEKDFIKFQDSVQATENRKDMLNWIKGTTGTQRAAVDYFIKLDSDLIQLDNDVLAVDNAIVAYRRASAVTAASSAKIIQAEISLQTLVDKALQQFKGTGQGGSGSLDIYLKLEHIKYKEQAAFSDASTNFLKIEQAFVKTDLEKAAVKTATDIGTVVSQTTPQNARAVDAFLKFEEVFIKAEADLFGVGRGITSKDGFSQAVVDYFIKIDDNYLKIDNDFLKIDSLFASTSAAGAANKLTLPPDVKNDITAQLNAVIKQDKADSLAFQKIKIDRSVDAYDSYLKIQGQKHLEEPDIAAFERRFMKLELQLIAADPTDLGDSATGAAGPVTKLGNDLAALDANETPAPAAVDAFIKFEQAYIKGESDFLKIENAILLQNPELQSTDALNYFIKIDGDYLKIDGDFKKIDSALGGSSATGSLLPADLVKEFTSELNDLNAQASSARDFAFQKIKIDRAVDAVDAYLQWDHQKIKLGAITADFASQFKTIEQDLIATDPTDLGDSSTGAGLATTLANDLDAMVGDNVPQGTRAVDAFLEFEEDFIKGETKFLKFQDEVAQKSSGQLAGAAVDFFLKMDADYLKMDADFVKINTVLGASSAAGTAPLLPPDVMTEVAGQIKDVTTHASTAISFPFQKVEFPVPRDRVDAFLKLDNWKFKLDATASELSINFRKIEIDFIAADPADLGDAADGTAGPATTLANDLTAWTRDAAPAASRESMHTLRLRKTTLSGCPSTLRSRRIFFRRMPTN